MDSTKALRDALRQAWTDFCDANPDDLTSPEGLPDHALMTCEQFVEYALAALSAQGEAAQPAADWRTMDSAPTYTLVLGFFVDRGFARAPFEGPNIWSVWQDEFGSWYGDHHSSFTGTEREPPTHWMPLPASPAASQG